MENKVEVVVGAIEIDVWQVWSNEDRTEGRGREYVLHYCRNEATAKRLAKGQYVMGTDSPVSKAKALLVDKTLYLPNGRIVEPSKEDIAAQKESDKKAELLEKIKSLGITDEELKLLYQK